MDSTQRALPKMDVPKVDMRNASMIQTYVFTRFASIMLSFFTLFILYLFRIVMENMFRDPRSRLMAGCSDTKNCQQRLSLFI